MLPLVAIAQHAGFARHSGFTQQPGFIQHPVSSEEIWLCREKLIEVDVEDGGVDVVGWIDQE